MTAVARHGVCSTQRNYDLSKYADISYIYPSNYVDNELYTLTSSLVETYKSYKTRVRPRADSENIDNKIYDH